MTVINEETKPRQAGTTEHERWCNRTEHAKVAAEGFGPNGCVGTELEAPGEIMGRVPSGWWVQGEPGAEPRFAVDWRLRFGEMSVEQVRFAYRLLLSVGSREIDTALELLAAALKEHDGQHPADAEDPI